MLIKICIKYILALVMQHLKCSFVLYSHLWFVWPYNILHIVSETARISSTRNYWA